MRLTPLKTERGGICFFGRWTAPSTTRSRADRLHLLLVAALASALAVLACGDSPISDTSPNPAASRPSILLVTLDTVRADAFGFEGGPAATPSLDRLADESTVLRGYATAPMTLPSHASMMTGLYPAEHGVHENARRLDETIPVLAEHLASAGYRTAAFVSATPLDGAFGLARGFDVYLDDVGGAGERSAAQTNGLALDFLQRTVPEASDSPNTDRRPTFLWVHYFDPHAPYVDGTTAASGEALQNYGDLGAAVAARYLHEIESVDTAFGNLLAGARRHLGVDLHVLVVGDHGESLGEHGERTHGNLLFEPVLRVPMIAHEPGRAPERPDHAVSVRSVFGTILDWAEAIPEGPVPATVFDPPEEPVLAEAMQPFLQYGWQPHVAAVAFPEKALLFGSQEFGASLLGFDLDEDPDEQDPGDDVPAELRSALRAYPLPASQEASPSIDPQMRSRLAELGYLTGSGTSGQLRADAPRAIDQTHIFDALDRASIAFERADYDAAIDPLQDVVRSDPNNFAAVLRLAVVYSVQGDAAAESWFGRAREIAPDSVDLQHYEGMHRVARGQLDAARTLFEAVLRREPNRITTLRTFARVATQQGDDLAASDALARLAALDPVPAELIHLGRLEMNRGRTQEALGALEQARALAPNEFDAALELGVLLLEARRFEEARDMLDVELDDRSAATRARRPMALFKRAQVAVLLDEPDADDRIRAAADAADASTAPLIANERLFEGRLPR